LQCHLCTNCTPLVCRIAALSDDNIHPLRLCARAFNRHLRIGADLYALWSALHLAIEQERFAARGIDRESESAHLRVIEVGALLLRNQKVDSLFREVEFCYWFATFGSNFGQFPAFLSNHDALKIVL